MSPKTIEDIKQDLRRGLLPTAEEQKRLAMPVDALAGEWLAGLHANAELQRLQCINTLKKLAGAEVWECFETWPNQDSVMGDEAEAALDVVMRYAARLYRAYVCGIALARDSSMTKAKVQLELDHLPQGLFDEGVPKLWMDPAFALKSSDSMVLRCVAATSFVKGRLRPHAADCLMMATARQ